ncbi:ribosomal natural product, two-chain TOMM family [Variovorax sp. YR266]|uniref:BMA_0021/BMA_0022 family TOMM bacteriocin n=1 Tax=Variovorax sp. YR266 TaxID=1884386 RepID=UPI00089C3647|nr:BMA_0021/BMA_0022 family TOMM bacteriocin [Variovorax sp. YR266]SDZ71898.1 ribosomal natural product, two-chain TOMM family [Variovorax sp. YR266]
MTFQSQAADPLLEFRLAYLRGIAKSWQDDAYRAKLLGASDIQQMLHDDFGLPTQWPLLDISLFQDPNPDMRAAWKPMLTSGWVGPDDSFVIVLPQAPSSQPTEALAAYYQLFPDFMGPAAAFETPTGLIGGALPTGLGIPGGGDGSLLAFGGVVLRAVALAWQSPEFLFDLTRDPDADKAPVLSQWLGYNNPFNFKILFTTNSAFTWDAAKGEWNLKGANGSLIKNGIRLNYPTAPVEVELRPIALTSYNNTGPAYPFTC